MGSKANPAVIGAFVVGAIALALIGVLVFGSGQIFKQTTRAVCFFSGDVSGLNVGAQVKFKGVDIGSVVDIRLRLGDETAQLSAETVAQGVRIPVIIEIDDKKLAAQGARLMDVARLKQLIDLGLRAQLVSQSLVTGLLLVQLDFHPDTPATFVLAAGSTLPEIPTIPTSLQQVQSAAREVIRKLEEIHFDTLVQSATEALDAVKEVVQSPGMQKTVAALPETMTNVNQTVTSVRELATRIDREQAPLLQSLTDTSNTAGATLEQARATLVWLQAVISPQAPIVVDATASLREIRDAARSVRLLADFLERDPSALIRGRYVKREE